MTIDTLPTAERVWRPTWPCPVDVVLRPGRRGAGDPTFRTDPDGTIWRGLRTPEGVVTLRVESTAYDGQVHAAAWGPGAQWVLDALPAMLGAEDDPSGFDPRHPVVARAHRFGERAPGPGVERGLWVQPSPEQLRLVPSWEWLRLHIDPARSRTIVRAAQVAGS